MSFSGQDLLQFLADNKIIGITVVDKLELPLVGTHLPKRISAIAISGTFVIQAGRAMNELSS